MSAQPIHTPKVMPIPDATPDSIRAVLVNADEPEMLAWFTRALDAAIAESQASSSIEPLNLMLREWRTRASEWCDPIKQKAFVERMKELAANGGIPADRRISTEQVLQSLEAKWGKGAMGPVWDKLAGRA